MGKEYNRNYQENSVGFAKSPSDFPNVSQIFWCGLPHQKTSDNSDVMQNFVCLIVGLGCAYVDNTTIDGRRTTALSYRSPRRGQPPTGLRQWCCLPAKARSKIIKQTKLLRSLTLTSTTLRSHLRFGSHNSD